MDGRKIRVIKLFIDGLIGNSVNLKFVIFAKDIQGTVRTEEQSCNGLTSGKPQLAPDRDWRPYLSPFEPQRRSIETSSCTQFATIKPVNSIIKVKYGIDTNYSERALSILSGNNPNGNSPNITAETLRKKGLLKEERLPFTDDLKSWGDYMSPDPLPDNLETESKQWGYNFLHEWVNTDPEKMWLALVYSTLGAAVVAWRKQGDFYVKEKGERDNHWTDIVWGKYREFWLIDDSYLASGERYKVLPWDYPFSYVKLYAVSEENTVKRPWYCTYLPDLRGC